MLTGKWIGYKEMESAGGKPFIIASIFYRDDPWEGLSTFDGNIIEEARNGSSGGAQGQAVKGKPVSNRDFGKEGYEKAICGLMNAFVHGYTANKGEGPLGKEMTMMGHRFHVFVKKLQAGEFDGKAVEEKDGENPF